MQGDLKNREDVFLLVDSFYNRIKKDELLGPIFNRHIKDWPIHLEHLTDFWETNLFMVAKFKGSPMRKHFEVDKAEDHSITEYHFGIWLNHWFQTIDSLFTGERAQLAKNRARQMGSHFYLKMFMAKPK